MTFGTIFCLGWCTGGRLSRCVCDGAAAKDHEPTTPHKTHTSTAHAALSRSEGFVRTHFRFSYALSLVRPASSVYNPHLVIIIIIIIIIMIIIIIIIVVIIIIIITIIINY